MNSSLRIFALRPWGHHVIKPYRNHCLHRALPIFITRYGINNVMLIGALISLVGLGVSVMFAPETRGLTLTQTGNMTLRGTPSDNPR